MAHKEGAGVQVLLQHAHALLDSLDGCLLLLQFRVQSSAGARKLPRLSTIAANLKTKQEGPYQILGLPETVVYLLVILHEANDGQEP